MVDSVGSIGQVGQIPPANNKSQKSSEVENSADVKHVDEVSISKEAQELADIENVAKSVSQELSKDNSATLSSDIEALSILV